jgi:hypothetical protein
VAPSGILGREPVQRRRQIDEHGRVGIFLDRERRRGVTNEQRHRAFARPRVLDEFRDFGGEIGKARARRLRGQQRGYDGGRADDGGGRTREGFL